MSRLTRGETAELVSRDQILRHARGQGNINFPCSADHEQDWQPYPVDPYSGIICHDHTYIHTYFEVHTYILHYIIMRAVFGRSTHLQQVVVIPKQRPTVQPCDPGVLLLVLLL